MLLQFILIPTPPIFFSPPPLFFFDFACVWVNLVPIKVKDCQHQLWSQPYCQQLLCGLRTQSPQVHLGLSPPPQPPHSPSAGPAPDPLSSVPWPGAPAQLKSHSPPASAPPGPPDPLSLA